MDKVTTLGIDLAKSVFQLHGVAADGRVLLRRQLRRSQMLEFFQHLPPCLIGMEACASAHYRARELAKFDHEVRLMQPSYVKGYVKRGKTDAADAEAICEAVSRPSMRFVPVKSEDTQALLMTHKAREFLVRQATPRTARAGHAGPWQSCPRTLCASNTVGFWNLGPMPACAMALSLISRSEMLRSPQITRPSSGLVLPVTISMKVVLPAPLGPMIARGPLSF
jgi:hypothetical protein